MLATKYRGKVLTTDFSERVSELVRQIYETFEIKIVKGVARKDHVHILVRATPTMAPSEIMSRLNVNTSSRLFEEFPHLKSGDWGGRRCFYVTVVRMTEEMIKNYFEHHSEPSPNDDFKTEPQ